MVGAGSTREYTESIDRNADADEGPRFSEKVRRGTEGCEEVMLSFGTSDQKLPCLWRDSVHRQNSHRNDQ